VDLVPGPGMRRTDDGDAAEMRRPGDQG
jgi:hypothetical protein